MMQALSLESFDTANESETTTTAAFEEGLRAGIAQAQAEAKADQTTLRAALVQAISDLQFTYVEARTEFIESLRPLLTAIPGTILPACVDTAYALQIARLMSEAARHPDTESMTLTVHPSAYRSVLSALTGSVLEVTVEQDPTLSPHAVWVGRSSGEVLIDLDALSAQITEVLSAVAETNEKRERNG